MRIALAFWGLTRSLKYTVDSIKKNILNELERHGIEYCIFMHTYRFEGPYSNPRTHERQIHLNFEEYQLLNPDVVTIDDQDEVKKNLDLKAYRTKGDPWRNKYASLDNFVCALYSKKKVTEMVENHVDASSFDYVMFLRPDVKYLVPFTPVFLEKVTDDTIAIPNFHMFCGFNDRFAICNRETYTKYGKLFDHLLAFSQRASPHSETMHARMMKHYNIKIAPINFFFNRVRATGAMGNDCPREYIAKFQPRQNNG